MIPLDPSKLYPTQRNAEQSMDSHTGGVGTPLYRAPETVQGHSGGMTYDWKVDIFSLGIVFYEMCEVPFETGHERHEKISTLRENKTLPEDFKERVPEYMQRMVVSMIDTNPECRPTVAQIKQLLLNGSGATSVTETISPKIENSTSIQESIMLDERLRNIPTYTVAVPFSELRRFGSVLGENSAQYDSNCKDCSNVKIVLEFLEGVSDREKLLCLLRTLVETSRKSIPEEEEHSCYAVVLSSIDNIFDLLFFSLSLVSKVISTGSQEMLT